MCVYVILETVCKVYTYNCEMSRMQVQDEGIYKDTPE